MKKVLISIIFVISFIILLSTNSNASSDLFLDNLNFEVNINSDGSMDVTETWNIEIEDTNTLFKTFKTDSTKFSRITNVQVTDITNGANNQFREIDELMYHVTKNCYYGKINDDGNFEIAWGVGLDNERADKIYKISYTVEDAIAKYNDYAELYWQFVGSDFEISAKNISGTITLPREVSNKEEIKVWGHTEDLNGEIYVTDSDKINFYVTNFNPGRYVEIRTLFPTNLIYNSSRTENVNILESVINEETVWANEANSRRETRDRINMTIIVVTYIICILLSIYCIRRAIKLYKKQKNNVKYKPTQQLEYFRELPRDNATPAQALKIYHESIGQFADRDIGKIVSATLLNLNLKKYINFEITKDKKKEIITMEIVNDNTNNLQEDEKVIFEFLKGACKEDKKITVKEFEKYIQKISPTKINVLKNDIYVSTKKEIVDLGIYDTDKEKEYKKYSASTGIFTFILFLDLIVTLILLTEVSPIVLGATLILAISSIISMIITGKTTKNINVYTQKGIDEKEKWKALVKYMEDFSMLDKRELPEITLWEHFLVYATVFGIAEKVLKQLKIVYANIEDIDVNTHIYMHLMLHTDFSRSFSNAISNSMSSAYSSANGSGGGFSGGRRRWPEAGGGGGR